MESIFYCVIPARGGSKRIPRKNIHIFHRKPMLAYPIEAAKRSFMFDSIVVSTDDLEIAQIAKTLGTTVPRLRNSELATDTASTLSVIQDAIRMFSLHL